MSRLLIGVVFLAACAQSPGEGKPKAEVSDVPAAEQPAATAMAVSGAAEAGLPVPKIDAATVLDVDRSQSKLGALGAKITAQHPIVFHKYDGKVGIDGDRVTAVAFAADVASLESDHPKLTQHLKAEDFLDVGRFPHATFASTEVKEGAATEGATHTVTGDLTIRGQTKRVTFPAAVQVGADRVTATSEFVIDRQDFGVTYPGKPDDLVKDEVLMQIAFVAPRR